MDSNLKVKVLDALKESQPTCFTKENVYKCINDGQVCFNGFVAELINGNKYEADDYWDEAYTRARDSADEWLLDEVKSQLKENEIWDDISEEEQNRIIDEKFEIAYENYEPEIDTSEVNDIIADTIVEDLNGLYDGNATINEINELHSRWVSNEIDFDLAMAELERLIVEEE